MHKNNRGILMMIISVVITLLIISGLTYAWMSQRAAMTTLLSIEPPDAITIIPTTENGVALKELVLDYNEETDRKDEDGTIHIYRPICIRSTEPVHQLEIVHTTNLNDLSFNLYLATKTVNSSNEDVITSTKDESARISGSYQNETTEGSKTAKPELLENYQDTKHVADTHAYPLYWVGANCCAIETQLQSGWQKVISQTEIGPDHKTYYNTYYILEISWKETGKETDLFYIMAQNIAV